jgi:hypothetical protein
MLLIPLTKFLRFRAFICSAKSPVSSSSDGLDIGLPTSSVGFVEIARVFCLKVVVPVVAVDVVTSGETAMTTGCEGFDGNDWTKN